MASGSGCRGFAINDVLGTVVDTELFASSFILVWSYAIYLYFDGSSGCSFSYPVNTMSLIPSSSFCS